MRILPCCSTQFIFHHLRDAGKLEQLLENSLGRRLHDCTWRQPWFGLAGVKRKLISPTRHKLTPAEPSRSACWTTPCSRVGGSVLVLAWLHNSNYLCDFTLELPWDRELLLTLSLGECSAEIFQWKLAWVRQEFLAQTLCRQHWAKVGFLPSLHHWHNTALEPWCFMSCLWAILSVLA